jgi:xylulokinase
LPYERLQREDVAALGCAIMAGHAVGLYPDMAATARRLAQTISRVEPRRAYHEHYQDYVAAYIKAFGELRNLYKTLTPLSNNPFMAQDE